MTIWKIRSSLPSYQTLHLSISRWNREAKREMIERKRDPDFKQQAQCTCCRKTDHQLDACSKFKMDTLERRLQFVKKNKLCFRCLSKGHMSSDFQKKLTHSTCNKKHPTGLHQERRETRSTEERRVDVPKSTSCDCTSQGVTSSTSMIVPVLLLASKRPKEEVRIYAILHTSDSTSVLKEKSNELDVEI